MLEVHFPFYVVLAVFVEIVEMERKGQSVILHKSLNFAKRYNMVA